MSLLNNREEDRLVKRALKNYPAGVSTERWGSGLKFEKEQEMHGRHVFVVLGKLDMGDMESYKGTALQRWKSYKILTRYEINI